MATTYYTDIQKLYVAYFSRPADPAGLAYWEGRVEAANGSTAAVSAEFATSAEYKALFANKTSEQVVDTVYQNLFGRSAEADGKAYWAKLLTDKTITPDTFVAEVAAAALGTDKTAFANKVTAAAAFTQALDTDAERAAYNADTIDMAKEFVANVTTDSTLNAAITPAALNATIGDIVAAGTPFTVLGALSGLQAATDARDAYLESITDADASATVTADDVHQAVTDATADFQTEFAAQNATAAATYADPATSNGVKAALIEDQIAHNVETLAADQKALNSINADIAKVSGLASAIAKLDASADAITAADKAETTATTNLDAAKASFAITAAAAITKAGGTLTVGTDGSVTLVNVDTTQNVKLVVVGTDGTLKLGTDVTEKAYPGITALLSASTAKEVADAGVTNANAVHDAAQAAVDKLDVDPSEAGALATLKTAGGFTTTPNTTQINDKLAALQTAADAETDTAGTAHTALNTFKSALTDYNTAVELNPLYAKYEPAAAQVETDATAISDFNDALAALKLAQQHEADLAGFDVSVAAATSLFAANDYNLVPVTDTFADTTVATGSSDVYVVTPDSHNTSISLFGLQGSDSIYIGEGYTVNTGKLSAGDNAKLELFVSQTGANTTLQMETSAFGSSAATPEVVKIVLVGVNATDVHLDSHGIITVGTPTA